MWHKWREPLPFETLLGLTMVSVENRGDEEIVFETVEGRTFRLYHDQVRCESVTVEDIAGDLDDLVGVPILMAEEVSNYDDPPPPGHKPDSYTWTFYKLGTIKGYVTIRWYGTSNGYYSEAVSFSETTNEH